MEILDRIAETYPNHTSEWTADTVRVERIVLPFYNKFELVRLITTLPERKGEARYADDGHKLIFIDGSVDTLFSINEQENLQLSLHDVSLYIRFFFNNTGDGRLHIVEAQEDISSLDWSVLNKTSTQVVKKVSPFIHPIIVSVLINKNYCAKATAIFENILVEVELEVEPSGKLSPLGQKLIMAV